jgi:predicted nucleotidyltransferase
MTKPAHKRPEPALTIKRWPTARSKAWTLQFLADAADNENILAVIAVGSAVRDAVTSVDLDLVVICKKIETMRLKPSLEIDLRMYLEDQVVQELRRGHDLLGWAIKFGRVLFQREQYWNTLSEFWRDRLPLPKLEVAMQRANAAFHRLAKVFELGDFDAAEEQALSYATHLARAELLRQNVYPASRPELLGQLRDIGANESADVLEKLLDRTIDHSTQISTLLKIRSLSGGLTRRKVNEGVEYEKG